MITFFAALCGGLVSAVITLVLGQPLQHYFWTRQRYAERPFAVIEKLNTLAAEVYVFLSTGVDAGPSDRARLGHDPRLSDSQGPICRSY
jgi:hypothetical protein